MKVIVDTAIWSLALRRTEPDNHVCQELTRLIDEQRVLLLGPVRQEILSGYSEESRFELLRSRLSCFVFLMKTTLKQLSTIIFADAEAYKVHILIS